MKNRFEEDTAMPNVPKAMFFTKGVGTHADQLTSFEMALRRAGIQFLNLVKVSSIFPPGCKIISRQQGQRLLKPGQITHCVMAEMATKEPNRLIVASIGLARPADASKYGYLSEHHCFGKTEKNAGDHAEDIAASMLATTLGIKFDPEKAWNERQQVYKASKLIVHTRNITQSAEGHKHGLWTTVIAVAVFIED
jgi:arginine decarboxylase